MAEKNLGALVVELLLKDAEFKTDLSKAASDFDVTSSRMQKTAMKLQSTATFAFKAIAASMAAFGATATIVGSKFEQQMAMVGAISGISQADEAFVMLEKHARKLGSTTEFTATQAAQALEELARGNVSAADSIEYSAQALALAGTSGAGLAEATKMIIAVQNTFGLTNTDVAHTTDVLSMAMRKSLFDFASLREAMKYGGVAGEMFGYTLEETVATMMKFKDLGLEGSMAGTQFRAALTMAGAQTQKQAKVLAKYNLTLQDINPNLHKLQDILKTVGDAGMSSTDVMKVFGRIAGGSVGILAKNAAVANDGIQDNINLLEQSSGAGKNVLSMYETIQETVSFQARVALSALQELFLSVFDLFRGPLKDLLKAIPDVLNEMSRTVQAHAGSLKARFFQIFGDMEIFAKTNSKMIADRFVGIMYTALDLAKVLKHIVDLFGFLINNAQILAALIPTVFAVGLAIKTASAVQAIATAFGAANVALQLFGTTLTVTTGGLYAIVVAIGAVVAGIASYFMFFNNATEATDNLREATDELAAARDKARESLVKSLDAELKNAQALARIKLLQGNLTTQERERLENLIKLNAATAMAGIENGELVKDGKNLISVKDLINKNEAKGIKIVDQSIKVTRREVSALKAREAIIRRQFDSYNRTTAAGTNSAAALIGLNAQLRGVLGKEVENIQQVEAALNGLVSEQEALTTKAIGLEQNKTTTVSALRKQQQAQQQQSIAQQQQAQQQANSKRASELQKLLEQVNQLEEKSKVDFQQVTMSKEEFAAHQYMKQIEDAQALFDELALMYKDDSAKRGAIVGRGIATIKRMQDTFNEEQAKKHEEIERQKAEKVQEIQKKAENKLRDLRRSEMSESKRLAEEKAEVLQGIMEADLATRVAIAEHYNKLIKEAEGTESEEDEDEDEEFLKKLMSVARAAARIVRRATRAAMAVLGGFKFDPTSMVNDLIEAKKRAEEEGLAFNMQENAEKMVGEAVDGALAFADTLVDMLPVLMGEFASRAPELMQKLAEALPVVIETFAKNIPVIINSFLQNLPQVVQGVVTALFNAIGIIVAQLPTILTSFLTETLPVLINTIVAQLPALILKIVAAIPAIIDAIIMSIPTIVGAVIDALPTLIRAVIGALPDILGALIAAIPILVQQLVISIVTQILPALPKIAMELVIGIVKAIFKFVEKIGQAIGDAFRSKKGRKKAQERRAQREADNAAQREQDLLEELQGSGASAFSGMSYVPATMRMTVHKGEAVIPADRAAQMRRGGPAAAGIEQNQNLSGSGGSAPIEISVIAEGRLLEAVQFKAESRGHADKMSKAIRRASGAVIGFQRGKFNAWTS